MTFNQKYFGLACTMAVVIVGNVLVAAETSQLRGNSGDGSTPTCVPGEECDYNKSCVIGSKQIFCNSLYPNVKGTFIVRDINPDIPATAIEVQPIMGRSSQLTGGSTVDGMDACDLCVGQASRSVPSSNYDTMVATGVAGTHSCQGLEGALASGIFSATVCPAIQRAAGATCCASIEEPPTRRLDTAGVVFTPNNDGGGSIASANSISMNNQDTGVAFTPPTRDPCPIQITLDSRPSNQGGEPVSNGNCSGYTGGKCDYSWDNKSYARCDCQQFLGHVEWQCYPNH